MESRVNKYPKGVPEWPGLKQPRPEEKRSNQENNDNKTLKRSDRQSSKGTQRQLGPVMWPEHLYSSPRFDSGFLCAVGSSNFSYTSSLQAIEMMIADLLRHIVVLQKVMHYCLHQAMVLRRNIKDENREWEKISAREEKKKMTQQKKL